MENCRLQPIFFFWLRSDGKHVPQLWLGSWVSSQMPALCPAIKRNWDVFFHEGRLWRRKSILKIATDPDRFICPVYLMFFLLQNSVLTECDYVIENAKRFATSPATVFLTTSDSGSSIYKWTRILEVGLSQEWAPESIYLFGTALLKKFKSFINRGSTTITKDERILMKINLKVVCRFGLNQHIYLFRIYKLPSGLS